MQPKLIVYFDNLSEDHFRTKAEHIVVCAANNPHFPEPWPAPVPSTATLQAHLASYQTAHDAAKNHDRAQATVRDVARSVVTKDFHVLAPYYEMSAGGDVTKLMTTGFDLRHEPVKNTSHEPLPAPAELKLTRAAQSGVLDLHAHSVPGADVYHVMVTTADPSLEANWVMFGAFPHCNKIPITGLTPGKIYFARIRAFNKNGDGQWATSGGVMAV